jgi:hypothetical protein
MSFLKFMMNEDIFYPDHLSVLTGSTGLRGSVRLTQRPSLVLSNGDSQPDYHDPLIHRLPHEILGVIFTYCLPKGQHHLPHIADAPLLLCRVSNTWRTVAISTPHLWTSLMLVLPPKATLEAFSVGASAWLSRSGALPLTIRMDAHPIFPLPSDFFDVFTPFFPRWHNIKLHIPSTSLAYLFRYPRAWSQLTAFTLSSDASLQDCITILTLCPNLQACRFLRILETSGSPIVAPLGTIRLAHLDSLKIYGREDLYIVLDCLETPRLRDLDLTFYWPQPWQQARMLGLFERSLCPLERLVIEGLDIPERDLVDCTRRLPHLRALEALLSGENLVTQKVLDIIAKRSAV